MGRCTEGAMRPETDAERHTYIYIYIFFLHWRTCEKFYTVLRHEYSLDSFLFVPLF